MKKKDIKTWVKALRSGEYEQCEESLYLGDFRKGRYCCLGVMIEELYDGEWTEDDSGRWGVHGESGMPSEAVLRDVGLRQVVAKKLAELNDDDGYSFEQIADWIESNPHEFLDS